MSERFLYKNTIVTKEGFLKLLPPVYDGEVKDEVKDKNLDGFIIMKDECYSNMIPILVGAINELAAKLEKKETEEKIDKNVNEKIKELEKRLLAQEYLNKCVSEQFQAYIKFNENQKKD